MENEKGELSTLKQVARDTGLSYRTVHRYVKLGRIKIIRLGASVRVPRKEYERVLTKGF